MNRDRMFELRVLTGTHAGARAILAGLPQTLGSDADCDLILSDTGVQAHHARLELREDGSTLLVWADDSLPPLEIQPGEGAALGPVHIVVEPSDAPWRDDVKVRRAQGQEAIEPVLLEEPEAPAPEEAAQDVSPQPQPQPQVLARVSAQAQAWQAALEAWWRPRLSMAAARGRRLLRLVPAVMVMGIAGAAAVFIWRQWYPEDRIVAPRTPAIAPGMPGSPLEPLETAIARLGFGSRVTVQAVAGREPVVNASFLSEEEMETLANTLSRLDPRPQLRVASEQDIVTAVTDRVLREAQAGSQALSVQYLGAGRFRVDGRVADDSQRAQVIANLERAFPQISGFESAMTTDADMAHALLEDLRQQGIGGLTGEWADGVLSVEVRLAPEERSRWERALVAVAARHDVPLRATVRELAGRPRQAPPVLPFTVRSIVSSDMPYVMLADGSKLVTGASVSGWRLVEVRANGVVFEGAQGYRITLER